MNEAMILGTFNDVDDDNAFILDSGDEDAMRSAFAELVQAGDEADNYYLVKVLASAETVLDVKEHC